VFGSGRRTNYLEVHELKFIKIIYFDESSVADFIQIVAEGALKRTTEFMTNKGR